MSVPYFILDGQPLLLPSGTQKVYDGGNWALYHSPLEPASYLVTRMNGGWRIRHMLGLVSLDWTRNFIRSCGGCLNPEG